MRGVMACFMPMSTICSASRATLRLAHAGPVTAGPRDRTKSGKSQHGKTSELTNIIEVCESGKMDFHRQSTVDADVAILASFGDVQTQIRIKWIRELNCSVSAFGQTHEISLSNRWPGEDPFGPFFA